MFNELVTAYKTEQEKRKLWNCGVVGDAHAIDENNKQYKLTDIPFERVDFVGGLWRVQRDFAEQIKKLNKQIQFIRDRDFVILYKMDVRPELNKFEYYKAASVGNNCYGLYSSMNPDHIVAKYDTDNGPLWSYGSTLEQARAFLGNVLFYRNLDLIHATERKNMQTQK